jgi:hypothetical protein
MSVNVEILAAALPTYRHRLRVFMDADNAHVLLTRLSISQHYSTHTAMFAVR